MTPTEKAEYLLVIFNDDYEASINCVTEIIKVVDYWTDVCGSMKSESKYWNEVVIILNKIHNV